MPKVTFSSVDQTCEADDGESLLDVALNHDVPIMHACGGFCACTTCHVIVKEGAAHLSEIDEDEAERMETLDGRTAQSRLGCQAKVHGDVTVEIVNLED